VELKLYPDRVLRRRCAPVREVTDEVLARAEAMREFMYEADGVGLAGPQVGWSEQIVTIDPEGIREDPRIFVNPQILEREGSISIEEGCLSLPGVRLEVPRAERVVVVTYTIRGERVELQAEGFAAIAWQHEVDHLNGVLIIDRVPATGLVTVRGQLRELEREAAGQSR